MKNCYDCKHLKAKLKLRHSNGALSPLSRIDYAAAIGRCDMGMLTDHDGNEKKFKNVLQTNSGKLLAYKWAERCRYFTSMV